MLKHDYSEPNMKAIFNNLTSSFDTINQHKWDILYREFQNLNDSQKELYDFEELIYVKKRETIIKVGLICEIVNYMKKNMDNIYSENFLKTTNCSYLKKYLKLFEQKIATFIIKMKNFSFYMTEKEKQKLENDILLLQNFLQEIESRKKKRYLSYYNVFYNGSAKKINIFGIKETIYEFI